MRHRWLSWSLLLNLACGSAAQPAGAPAGASSDGSKDSPCPETSESSTRSDPTIMALAEAAKTCEFSAGRFNWECAELKAWREPNRDLFEGPDGNPTLLTMLESEDVRMRALAIERKFVAGRTFFANRKNAARLLAVVDAERETTLLSTLGEMVAQIDGEKVLGKELREYAKHPSSEFRSGFAAELLPQHPTEFSLSLAKVLLEDTDWNVRRSVLRSLSSDRGTRSTPPICALLKSQIGRDDKLAEDALSAASSSNCPGMTVAVIEQIERRAKVPAKLNDDGAPNLRSPLQTMCWDSETDKKVKGRAFDVAAAVTPHLTGSWEKRSWLDLFRICDKSRAKAALTPFTTDADKDVASAATSELQRLEEELSR